MTKKNFEEVSKQILELVGGKKNVVSVLHCITRLRFNVRDKGLVKTEELEKIECIKGVQWFSEQLQIIIGVGVEDLYKATCKIGNFEESDAIDENLDLTNLSSGEKVKKFLVNLFTKIANVFTELLPALTACGMCTTLRLILVNFNILPSDNSTIIFMNAIGNVCFYFMPFFAAVNTCKEFKIRPIYGILIAGCLLEPTIASYAGSSIHYLFVDIPVFGYSSSIIPALFCTIVFSYVFNWIDPRLPQSYRTLLMGLISCVIVIPALMMTIAPIGYWAGVWLANGVQGFYDTFGIIAAALFTGLLSFIIMTGMHHTINTVFVANFATLGYCPIKPALLLNNICVAGSTLGFAIHIKDKDERAACVADGVMGIFGRSEPALYGFGFKYKAPIIGNVVGGLVSGALYYSLGVRQYVNAPGNIFSLPSYLTSKENFIGMLVSVVAAFVVSFIISLLFGKKALIKKGA